jgi:DNA-binding transcriptional ArsR family regulator
LIDLTRIGLTIVRLFCIIRHMSDKDLSDTSPSITHLDYELADTLNVDTAERMKALGDPLRLLIVDLVLEQAMTVTDLAERVQRPRGSVAHHVKVLEHAGLLQVVRTRKVRAIEERFYGRAARTYVMPDQPGQLPFLEQVLAEIDREYDTGPDSPAGATYRRARIPAERAAEFGERLKQLSLEFAAEPRGGDVEYGMYLALFPTNRSVTPPAGQQARRD